MKIIFAKYESVEKTPKIYFKPDSALVRSNKPFYIPEFSDNIVAQACSVLKISRLGKNIGTKFAERYFSEISIGVCFTAQNLSDGLAYSFDYSAVVSDFSVKENFDLQKTEISFFKNDILVSKNNFLETQNIENKIITYISSFCTLKMGDLIFLVNKNNTKMAIGDTLTAFLNENKLIEIKIK